MADMARSDAYITWINDGEPAWRLGAGGLGKNDFAEIAARPVPKEPMVSLLYCPDCSATDLRAVHHHQLGSFAELR